MAVYRNGTKVVRCFANNPLLHRQLVSASRLIEIFGVVDFFPRPFFLYWSHRVRSWIGAWQWWISLRVDILYSVLRPFYYLLLFFSIAKKGIRRKQFITKRYFLFFYSLPQLSLCRAFRPDFVLIRQNMRDAGEDYKSIVLGLKFGGVPSINSLETVYHFQVRLNSWSYCQKNNSMTGRKLNKERKDID